MRGSRYLGKPDGFEPFCRWAVETSRLDLLDDCEQHEVREIDGEHFRWAWDKIDPDEQ